MKEVFRMIDLRNLPQSEDGKFIYWSRSIGLTVPFQYDDIFGEFKIVKVSDGRVTFTYQENEYNLKTNHFKKGKMAYIFGGKSKVFRYEVGDIIECKCCNVEILEKIYRTTKQGARRAYRYRCLTEGCFNEDFILETDILRKHGCPKCCDGSKVKVRGLNDMFTKAPDVAALLANPEDGYRYGIGTKYKLLFKCPDCGHTEYKTPRNVWKQGFSCSICGDGISYNEKYVYNMLTQLDLDFNFQLKLDWSENRIYDFYFELNNEKYVLEVHGRHHYEDIGLGRGLENERINDTLKKKLANQNNVEYIAIDCRKSNSEWLKKQIITSLGNILVMDNIDWEVCDFFATSNLQKMSCELWNRGLSVGQISEITKISKTTIAKYLKKASQNGTCHYNPKLSRARCSKKYVVCLDTGDVFPSINYCVENSKEVLGIKNLSAKGIASSCSGTNKTHRGKKFKYTSYHAFLKYINYPFNPQV